MKPAVLDASALLAMFFGEPAVEEMRGLFSLVADRMQARDSKRSPDQRITRAVGYLNKKAAQKAAGQ